MTVQPSTEEEQSPAAPDGSPLGGGAVRPAIAPEVEGRIIDLRPIGAPTARPKKADYRLRGLDLDAPALAEAPARPQRTTHPSVTRRRRRHAVQLAIALAVVAVVALALRAFVVEPYHVDTTSMLPTLPPGTGVLVVRPELLTGSIGVGDIVVFHPVSGTRCEDTQAGRDMVKRVIATAGQTVWSAGERIWVDGRPLHEPGWYNPPFGEVGPTPIARTTVPSGSYFVLGDNRTDTCDSRAFGAVPASRVVGEVVATVTRDGHPSVHGI